MPVWVAPIIATLIGLVLPIALVQLNHMRRMRNMRRAWAIEREAARLKFEEELAAIRARANRELR